MVINQTDAHAAGDGEQVAVLRHVAGLACNVGQTVLGDMAVHHATVTP